MSFSLPWVTAQGVDSVQGQVSTECSFSESTDQLVLLI